MALRTGGRILVDNLIAPRRRPRVLRAGRELSRRDRGVARGREPGQADRLPAGGRRRQHGGGLRQADRPAGRLLRHARARRRQCADRPAYGAAGFHADDPSDRAGGPRRARPRGVPGGRLPPHARRGHQVGRPGGRSGAHPRIRGARLCHRHVGTARAGGAGLPRGRADGACRDRGRPADSRSSSRRRRRRRWRSSRSFSRRRSGRSRSSAAAAGRRRRAPTWSASPRRSRLPVAAGVPLPGPHGQHASALCRRARHDASRRSWRSACARPI